MARRVGARATFDISDFTRNVQIFINKMKEAADATKQLEAAAASSSTAFTQLNNQLKQFASNATASLQIAQQAQAAAATVPKPKTGPTGIQKQIEELRLLKEEYAGLKRIRSAQITQTDDASSQAAKDEAKVVQALEESYQQLRRQKFGALGLDPADLDALSNYKMTIEDLGRGQLTRQKRLNDLYAAGRAELRDTARDQILREQLASGTLSKFEKQTAEIERQQIALRRAARDQQLRFAGPKLMGQDFFKEIRGLDTVDQNKRTLQIQQMLTAEIRDRQREVKIENELQRTGLQALERQALLIERAALASRRTERDKTGARLGFDPKAFDDIRNKNFEIVDALERQAQQIRLLSAEMQDRIREEQIRRELADKTTAAYKRQQLALQQQQIATRRGLRDRQAKDLGIPQSTIDSYRRAAIEIDKMGRSAQRSETAVAQFSARAIAFGVAFGALAANAIRNFAQGMRRLTRELFDLVSFFERLELSVEFFVARSFIATGRATDFASGLAIAGDEAEGLLIWLQRLAVASPFTTKDVGTLFRTAQAYGLTRKEAELFTPLLLDFAAAAGLSEDILERLALAIGQIRSRGKLTGEEVRQLGNSGLPIRDILVKNLGFANDQFDELLESGALTSDVVIPNIIRALKDFEGQGERVAFQTLTGIVSAFKELGQIQIARFFKGAIPPIRAFFKELFDYLSDERFIAWAQVIGRDVGLVLLETFKRLERGITGFLRLLREMDPLLKGQIVVFFAASAGVLALAASLGALFFVVNVITSPLGLLTVGIGLLVSEWSVGFRNVLAVTRSAGAGIIAIWSTIGSAFGSLLSGITSGISSFLTGISDLFASFVEFGSDMAIAFAEGWSSSVHVIGSALMTLGELFNAVLGVHSNPDAVPNLDKIGKPYTGLFVDGILSESDKEFNRLATGFEKGFSDNVFKPLHLLNTEAGRRSSTAIYDAWTMDMESRSGQFGDAVVEVFQAVEEEAEPAAAAAGLHVSEAFVDSFRILVPQLAAKISDELSELLAQIAGGRQLSRSGIDALDGFLKPFKDPDFGAFGQIVGFLGDNLRSLVDLDDINEIDVPRILFGARTDISRAINQIRTLGSATKGALDAVRSSAGAAGNNVVALIQSYSTLARDTNLVEESQKRLTEISKKYKDILTPIREELQKISDARRIVSEDRQIIEFQRVIANEAASFARKREAELSIAEILQKRRVRTIESERDAVVNATEDEIEARQKVRDESQTAFDVLKSRFDEQNKQLGLVAQEASLLDKLNEQADKLKKKQKSGLDLQLELQKLQQAEIRDTIKATKAKYILDQADSTELEKMQATQDLIEVSLQRQKRLQEAAELGIGPEQLRRYRDIVLTLEDIGIKSKGAGFEGSAFNLDDFESQGPDAIEIAEQFKRIVGDVEAQWIRLKESIKNTFTTLNDNLPFRLQFLPDEKGNIGLVSFLEDWSDALVTLFGVFVTYRVLANISQFAVNLKTLFAVKGIAAAASGGGLVAAIKGIGAAAVAASPYILLLAAAIGTLVLAWQNWEDIKGGVGVLLGDEGALKRRDERQQFLEENPEQRNILSRTFPQVMPGLESYADSINEYANGLYTYFEEALVASDQQKRLKEAMLESVVGGMPATPDFAAPTAQVGTNLAAGVAEGLSSEEAIEATRLGGRAFLGGMINILEEEAGIQSPSTLFATAIGVPIAEGIVAPLQNLLETFQGGDIVEGILGFFDGIKQGALGSLTAMKAGALGRALSLQRSLVARTNSMRDVLTSRYELIRTAIVRKATLIKNDVVAEWVLQQEGIATETDLIKEYQESQWTLIHTDVTGKAMSMSTTVVGYFTSMRTGAESQAEMLKTNVLGILVNNEDSLTEKLMDLFVGTSGEADGSGGSGGWAIGAAWSTGVAKGITDTQQIVANAMLEAFAISDEELAKFNESKSPSQRSAREVGEPWALGVALGIMRGAGAISDAARTAMQMSFLSNLNSHFGSVSSAAIPGNVSNSSLTTNYNLNVASQQTSQGIIQDFNIMRVMSI